MQSTKLIPVQVIALLEERVGHTPVVLLLDKEQNRLLPIWIGEPEARAILIGLNKIETQRPLTHKLLQSVIHNLKGKLEKIVVDRIENGTFYATLHIKQQEETILIDSRPSDAIALALEINIPIFVAEAVMQEAGRDNPLAAELTEEISYGEKTQKNPVIPKLSEEEIKKLKKLLEEARQRERTENS